MLLMATERERERKEKKVRFFIFLGQKRKSLFPTRVKFMQRRKYVSRFLKSASESVEKQKKAASISVSMNDPRNVVPRNNTSGLNCRHFVKKITFLPLSSHDLQYYLYFRSSVVIAALSNEQQVCSIIRLKEPRFITNSDSAARSTTKRKSSYANFWHHFTIPTPINQLHRKLDCNALK